MPINPDPNLSFEEWLETAPADELEEYLATVVPDAPDTMPVAARVAARVTAELERRRAGRRDVATARTVLEIVETMRAMVSATPWQPGDPELDDELELVAGAIHLLARRAIERRRELDDSGPWLVGLTAAELAEIRRRFGINVARLITEGTAS